MLVVQGAFSADTTASQGARFEVHILQAFKLESKSILIQTVQQEELLLACVSIHHESR